MFSLADLCEKFTDPVFDFHFANFLFSFILFCCIVASRNSLGVCLFNGHESACKYGVGLGMLSLLSSLFFLALEFNWSKIIKWSKLIYIVEISVSGACCLLYCITLLSLWTKWNSTTKSIIKDGNVRVAEASIALSLLNAISWGGATYLLFKAFISDGLDKPGPNSYHALGSGNDYIDPVTSSYQNLDANLDSQVHNVYTAPFLTQDEQEE